MMAMARINVPGIFVYAGTILPGTWKGQKLTIVSAFEAVGARAAGKMSQEDFDGIEKNACPSVGACGGQFHREHHVVLVRGSGHEPARLLADGLTPQGKSRLFRRIREGPDERDPQEHPAARHHHAQVDRERRRAGDGHRGSTNAVLHYLAIASAAGVKWTLDDFERVRKKVPVLCDLKPSGQYVAVDFHNAGGVPQVLKMLLVHGLLHGECLTITGRTLAEELAPVPDEPRRDQNVIRPWNNPMYAQGISRSSRAILRPRAASPRSRD